MIHSIHLPLQTRLKAFCGSISVYMYLFIYFQKQSGFKVAAFYIHVLVLIGLCAAVSVIVGLKLLKGQGGDDDDD